MNAPVEQPVDPVIGMALKAMQSRRLAIDFSVEEIQHMSASLVTKDHENKRLRERIAELELLVSAQPKPEVRVVTKEVTIPRFAQLDTPTNNAMTALVELRNTLNHKTNGPDEELARQKVTEAALRIADQLQQTKEN